MRTAPLLLVLFSSQLLHAVTVDGAPAPAANPVPASGIGCFTTARTEVIECGEGIINCVALPQLVDQRHIVDSTLYVSCLKYSVLSTADVVKIGNPNITYRMSGYDGLGTYDKCIDLVDNDGNPTPKALQYAASESEDVIFSPEQGLFWTSVQVTPATFSNFQCSELNYGVYDLMLELRGPGVNLLLGTCATLVNSVVVMVLAVLSMLLFHALL